MLHRAECASRIHRPVDRAPGLPPSPGLGITSKTSLKGSIQAPPTRVMLTVCTIWTLYGHWGDATHVQICCSSEQASSQETGSSCRAEALKQGTYTGESLALSWTVSPAETF